MTKPRDDDDVDRGNRALLSSVARANGVVSTSLHRAMRQHARNKEYDAQKDGLDFLQAKNGLMTSYLVDLTLLLRCRLNASGRRKNGGGEEDGGEGEGERSEGESNDARQRRECLERLLETRTALEKLRPMEKRMRYQIDKLLALSTLGAGTFAAVGREEEEEEKEEENDGEMSSGKDGDEDKLESRDPLSFKPDLKGMMKMFEEDAEEPNDDDSDGDVSDDEDEPKSSGPRIALEKDDDDAPSGKGVYQPPRLQSAPFELDNEAKLAKRRILMEKQRAKQSRSELTQLLKSQLTDAPETEDAGGGAMLGRQSEKSRRMAAREEEVKEFEESQMIRLTVGKKEKKERKRMMREETSNLGAIAGGWGGLAAGVDDAFGGGGRDDDDVGGGGGGGGGGAYKTKGMRKRRVDVLEGGQKKRSGKKKKGPANEYQKSLYGGRGMGGGGGGKSRRKK